MNCILTIVRYPRYCGFAGFLSMALFRLPLFFNKRINFYKLLGCGKNGTFDIHPDWRQWGILIVNKEVIPGNKEIINYQSLHGSFINWWWRFFCCEKFTVILEAIEGHGSWDGKNVFGKLPVQTEHEGMIAVLTRATIRLKRLKNFWSHVEEVSGKMNEAPGFIMSIGIGEVPWIKQATFSVWLGKEYMKQFAYKTQEHAEVIRKTRSEQWYSEDMFVRFKVINVFGTIRGKNPLLEKTGL